MYFATHDGGGCCWSARLANDGQDLSENVRRRSDAQVSAWTALDMGSDIHRATLASDDGGSGVSCPPQARAEGAWSCSRLHGEVDMDEIGAGGYGQCRGGEAAFHLGSSSRLTRVRRVRGDSVESSPVGPKARMEPSTLADMPATCKISHHSMRFD